MCRFLDTGIHLYTLLQKEATLHWTNTDESAMLSLCTILCSHPAITLLDFTKPFQIKINAFDNAVDSVLTQEYTFIHKPIAFLGKT